MGMLEDLSYNMIIREYELPIKELRGDQGPSSVPR